MKKLDNILLIDDDEDFNFFSKRILQRLNCANEIDIAYNGVEALEILKQKETFPNLIFLDINMFSMNGWEFLNEYQKIPLQKRKSTVVCMLTSSADPDDRKRALNHGLVNEFEEKPLSENRVKELLLSHF